MRLIVCTCVLLTFLLSCDINESQFFWNPFNDNWWNGRPHPLYNEPAPINQADWQTAAQYGLDFNDLMMLQFFNGNGFLNTQPASGQQATRNRNTFRQNVQTLSNLGFIDGVDMPDGGPAGGGGGGGKVAKAANAAKKKPAKAPRGEVEKEGRPKRAKRTKRAKKGKRAKRAKRAKRRGKKAKKASR